MHGYRHSFIRIFSSYLRTVYYFIRRTRVYATQSVVVCKSSEFRGPTTNVPTYLYLLIQRKSDKKIRRASSDWICAYLKNIFYEVEEYKNCFFCNVFQSKYFPVHVSYIRSLGVLQVVKGRTKGVFDPKRQPSIENTNSWRLLFCFQWIIRTYWFYTTALRFILSSTTCIIEDYHCN